MAKIYIYLNIKQINSRLESLLSSVGHQQIVLPLIRSTPIISFIAHTLHTFHTEVSLTAHCEFLLINHPFQAMCGRHGESFSTISAPFFFQWREIKASFHVSAELCASDREEANSSALC